MIVYPITPCPKPRMTQRDRWQKRPAVLRYWEFKDQIRALGVTVPECCYHVTFVLPMPASWSVAKKAHMDGKPHRQKPDKDNLEKGLLDAIYADDAHVWDGRVTKVWGREGQIIVRKLEGPFPEEDGAQMKMFEAAG